MKKHILLLFLSLTLHSSEYCVELDGDKIATLPSLQTINNGYLKTELNWKASLYSGYDFLVVYDGQKLKQKENTKYIKDEAGLLSLLRFFNSNQTPKNPIIIDNEKQFLSLKCKDNLCKFSAQNKLNLKIYQGYIKKRGSTITDIYESRNKLRIRII